MYYLIDGYNFLFHLIDSEHPIRSQRDLIVRSMQKEFALLGLEGMIVFDGSHSRGEESGLSYKSPLVIAYSHKGETADRYILDKIEFAERPSEMLVVTDDRSLSAQARALGAKTLPLKTFLAQMKKKRPRQTEKKGALRETKQNFDRLLKIFEQRRGDEE